MRSILLSSFLIGTFLAAASQVGAQQDPDTSDSQPRSVRAYIEAGVRLSDVSGQMAPLLTGSALVALTPRLAIGGSGTILLSDRKVEGDLVFPRQELGFGYGGVLVEGTIVQPNSPGIPTVVARALLGAGNVDLRDRIAGIRLASDNVYLVEPEILVRIRVGSRFHGSLGASYRLVWGLQDIAGIATTDLRALAVGISVSLGPL